MRPCDNLPAEANADVVEGPRLMISRAYAAEMLRISNIGPSFLATRISFQMLTRAYSFHDGVLLG